MWFADDADDADQAGDESVERWRQGDRKGRRARSSHRPPPAGSRVADEMDSTGVAATRRDWVCLQSGTLARRGRFTTIYNSSTAFRLFPHSSRSLPLFKASSVLPCLLPTFCCSSADSPATISSSDASFMGAATFAILPLDLDLLDPAPAALSPSLLPSALPPDLAWASGAGASSVSEPLLRAT